MFKIRNNQGQKIKNSSISDTVFLFFLTVFFSASSVNAQCAMCRASIESEGDTSKATALNDGIVYLMAIPYILIALLGFAIYKMYANKKKV